MYARKTTRKHKHKTYNSYLLVESVATPKGPRQKTICSLRDLSPRPREEWLKVARKMHAALAGQEALFDEEPEVAELLESARTRARRATQRTTRGSASKRAAVSIDPEKVALECPREAGAVHVGLSFWKRLGFDELRHRK